MNMKKIAFDAYWAHGEYRGMGRYVRDILIKKKEDVLALVPGSDQGYDFPTIYGRKSPFPVWEQFHVPLLCAKNKIDIFVAPYNTAPMFLPTGTKLCLIIQDLIFFEKTERKILRLPNYQDFGRHYRKLICPMAAARADMIITSSHYSAGEIANKFGIEKEKITVIPCQIPNSWCLSEMGKKINDTSKPFIFTVSGQARSKNLEGLIRAVGHVFNNQPSIEHRLVIGGVAKSHHEKYQALARALGIADRVTMLGFETTEKLQKLYQEADIFVMPSYSEGFGIPLLEAMASGTPIACSNRTSMPEVAGEAAILFDPFSVLSMAQSIGQLLTDQGLKQELVENGYRRVKHFTEKENMDKIELFWDRLTSL